MKNIGETKHPLKRAATAVMLAGISLPAAMAQTLPDAGRLLEGARTAPEAARPAAEINIGLPLRVEPRTPPPRSPVMAEPKPSPAAVAEAAGPFSEKELLELVGGILGKGVTQDELREMRAIALAIVACFRSPACAAFSREVLAASGMTDALKGGLAVAKPPQPKPPEEERFNVAGFRFTGISVIQEQKLTDLLKEYQGRSLTLNQMKDAAAIVEEYYRSEGYILARAFLPPQTSKDGIVEIAVLEGRLGETKVQVAGDTRLNPGVAEGLLADLKPGTTIDERTLERALLLVSDLPGLRVRSTLSPGAQVGTADAQIELEGTGERARGSLELDNFGSKYSGQTRYIASANLVNPTGYGDIFGVRAMRSEGGETTLARLSYTLPVGSMGTRIGANYSQLEYKVGGPFSNLGARGTADVTSLFAQHPFIRTRNNNFYGYLGYDLKKLQDRFDSIAVENPRTSNVVIAGVSGDLRDNYFGGGVNTFSLNIARGELEFHNANQDAADKANTGRSTGGTFIKSNLGFSRLQSLSSNWSVLLGLTGQWANKNLDSSERMSLGGPTGVRAYPVGESPSDMAWIGSAELRYAWRMDLVPGDFTAFGFWDQAKSTINANPRITDVNNIREVAGWGLGLDWNRPADFSVRLVAAFRPSGQPLATAETQPSNATRFWLQGVKWW